MDKLEKLPMGWSVFDDLNTFKLADAEGKIKSSIVYNFDKDNHGRTFAELISVGSGKEQGRGYYSLLYSGFESFVISKGVEYLQGFISPQNIRSIQVHNHLGFCNVEILDFCEGKERRIRVEKALSI